MAFSELDHACSSRFEKVGYLCRLHQKSSPWLVALHEKACQTFVVPNPPPHFAMEHFLTGAQATSELRNDVRRTLRSVSPEVLAFRVRAVMTCDATEEFARIRVPTLYVQGEQDRLVSKSSFEEIKALQPDVILAVIGGPHFVLQREPHDAAEVVAHFVADLPS